MTDQKHKHVFDIPKQIKVPLAKYEVYQGKMRFVSDTGYDIINQLECSCGQVETIDMKRETAF